LMLLVSRVPTASLHLPTVISAVCRCFIKKDGNLSHGIPLGGRIVSSAGSECDLIRCGQAIGDISAGGQPV
jgi:hypothetical protein